VFIDGFNFYYGVVKGTPYRWLDLQSMCRRLLPALNVARIEYFTARVRPTPQDPTCHLRQSQYLAALQTLTDFEIIEGSFSVRPKRMPLLNATSEHPSPTDIQFPLVHVLKSEEKGSDVSIGARMVFEGCRGQYDVAVVVSNDSDLLEPIRLVKNEVGLQVGVVMPCTSANRQYRGMASVFSGRVDFIKPSISTGLLKKCQFPSPLAGPTGPITKPVSW
jgi:hypothetical protein